MQTYFFDFFEGARWSYDRIGQVLGSLNDARKEARLALIEIAKSYPASPDVCMLLYDIKDEEGRRLCRVTLSLTEETAELPPPDGLSAILAWRHGRLDD